MTGCIAAAELSSGLSKCSLPASDIVGMRTILRGGLFTIERCIAVWPDAFAVGKSSLLPPTVFLGSVSIGISLGKSVAFAD